MNEDNVTKLTVSPRIKNIAYWITTVIIVLETAAGAQWDLSANAYVTKVFNDLGYPLYLLTIIGIWKILAVVVLLINKFPRIKEWAYAGVFFVYSGAAASHLFANQAGAAVGPLIFCLITLASYYLRPKSRCLIPSQQFQEQVKRKKWKAISYWTTIVILGYVLLSGGIGEMLHLWGTLETVTKLGYPIYFLTIIAIWKILGGIAITVPKFPRLKEWAYAGIFFNMTGASISHAMCGDYGSYAFHIIVPLVIAGIAIVSWALRPSSRTTK